MASRNGLNPKIRSPKGVGHGRALPAPFGFDNGIFPDGVDDYLTVPGMIGKPIPDQFTVEFWVKFPDPVNDLGGIFRLGTTGGQTITISRTSAPLNIQTTFANVGAAKVYTLPSDTRKASIAFGVNMITGDIFHYANSTLPILDNKSIYTTLVGATIENFEFFTTNGYTIGPSNVIMDEFRFYDTVISDDQFLSNYNNGTGNNPFQTENLMAWYKFERFESLDFSVLQDGSDVRLGIRDFSGRANHAQPFNMITDIATEGYVLKPF